MNYRAFDLNYLDIDRAKVFISDLQEFERSGTDAEADVYAARQRSSRNIAR